MGLAVLIDRPGYRLVTDRKLLKRDEVSLAQDVAHAFSLARQQLAATLAAGEQECAQRAIDGYKDGLARAEHEAAQRLMVAEVDRQLLLDSLRPALAELVVEAITLLAKGLDPQALFAQALHALQGPLRDASWARLRVHPASAGAARAALAEFTRDSGLGTLARVETDDAMPVDGCIFESEFGKVDANLDTQLDAIRGAIDVAARQLAERDAFDARRPG